MSDKTDTDGFDADNAKALTEMLVNPQTSEAVRLQIINELNEEAKSDSFFETMYSALLSLGRCPHCAHENHWLIPEDDLAQMGWVTPDKDDRVPKHTDKNSCPQFMEACSKQKSTV